MRTAVVCPHPLAPSPVGPGEGEHRVGKVRCHRSCAARDGEAASDFGGGFEDAKGVEGVELLRSRVERRLRWSRAKSLNVWGVGMSRFFRSTFTGDDPHPPAPRPVRRARGRAAGRSFPAWIGGKIPELVK
jgi:hypothetical protein